MASLADPGEWLVVPFVVILTTIVLMQGVLMQGALLQSSTIGGVRPDLRDTGTCERAHFFLPFH
jgi:hypothetical protein